MEFDSHFSDQGYKVMILSPFSEKETNGERGQMKTNAIPETRRSFFSIVVCSIAPGT